VTHRDPPHKSHTFQNFILKTDDIWSNQWSDPIYFDYYAFDPSVFFDDDGKAYVHGATMPGPKTTIDLFELDLNTGKRLGEQKTIWIGETHFFPEGPHIYKKDGWYYCMIAEDGTHDFHAIKIARSKKLFGPYEAYGKNPILTAVGTSDYYSHLGHGDLFQDTAGQWWCVCLGVRKSGGRFALSRETFLTQVDWPEDEWPSIARVAADPPRLTGKPISNLLAGSDEDEVLFIRKPAAPGYKLDGNTVSLTPSKQDLSYAEGLEPISFAARRQRVLGGSASVKMNIASTADSDCTQAGLAYFKDEHRFIRIFYDFSSLEVCFDAVNVAQSYSESSKQRIQAGEKIEFQVSYTEEELRFTFRQSSSDSWTELGAVDTLKMSDFDFVGPVIGVFAFGEGPSPVMFEDLKVD
jgi:beta-xylosidase